MSSLNCLRVRDLIRAVRKCKSPSEEQALINRERAKIVEEALRDRSAYTRSRNMLKLMFISMIGYSTSSTQLEIVHLLAQGNFSGKRIGYLALSIMTDENDEILTLVENHMKNDFSDSCELHQVVALNAAANTASEDMSRDILDDVLKLMKSRSTVVRRKAHLCALRIARKVPEYIENFLTQVEHELFGYMGSKSLLCALTLINYCLQKPEGKPFLPHYRALACTASSRLVEIFSSFDDETVVDGVSDPFVQVKLMEFLRIVGKDYESVAEVAVEPLNSVLALPGRDTNANNMIRYECARTMLTVLHDVPSRRNAINMMFRFLETKTSNFRFVALNCLGDYAHLEIPLFQAHQHTILDLMKDSDVSIRSRALNLTVKLITNTNVRLLVPDLLDFLKISEGDLKIPLVDHLCTLVEEKSPSEEWRIDMSLKILKAGEKHVKETFSNRFIALVSQQNDELKLRVVTTLWGVVSSRDFDALVQNRVALMLCAIWCVGEFGLLLVDAKKTTAEEIGRSVSNVTLATINNKIKLYGMTAMMKLASRCAEVVPAALKMFGFLLQSMDCELRQRASEYTVLLKEYQDAASFCFSPVPPVEPSSSLAAPPPSKSVPRRQSAVMDTSIKALDDLFGSSANAAPLEQSVGAVEVTAPAAHADPLALLFGDVVSPC